MKIMFAIAVALISATNCFHCAAASAAGSILIDFSSSNCPPCRAMQPVIDQLEQTGVPVRHVDVDSERDLARRYGIRQTPTFVIVSGGKEVTRLVGTQSLAQLRDALAINPSGPLVQTGSMSASQNEFPRPQTRLAPMGRLPVGQTLASAASRAAEPMIEPMPSMSKADAIERARAATVRLRVHDGKGYGAGTGTIIDTQGEEALVLTCGHLFRETKGEGKIEVDLFVGGQVQTVLAQLLDYDAEDRDIALVVIRPGVAIEPVEVISSVDQVRVGQPAFSYGCDRGDDPTRRDTRLTGVNKYDQHINASNLEIEGAPIDGRSGGGLFDDAGRLIGVCNAADYKGDVGIYAGPGAVHWQLDQVNLTSLYQRERPAAAPERIASLNQNAGMPAAALQPSAIAPAAFQPASVAQGNNQGVASNQEVIVIIRDRNSPDRSPQVMTVNEPTADFLQMVQQQAR
ncbi:Thioredoxin [Novipirellula galeiformis]|uniref:Thioredoxin n=1 Tax=Novipirellula galeiformis TaxID=2528004 RepID=A0A5C6CAL3_9BACT|nr:trypsin-like peptidase domain-containing protein [Novipirellula galeiformis]TWU20521.1 Thioredoxin [Novipirellula galeiformis]